MNLLSSFAPPSTLQVGIRALSRHPDRIGKCAARQLSRPFRSTSSRSYSTSRTFPSPSRALRDSRCHVRQLLPRTSVRTIFKFRAITHYSFLPREYEDALGLEFRKEDLTQAEVNQIFGRHLPASEANQLLKIIHGRRVAGTLDDPDLQENTAGYSAQDKIKALEYLRKNIPVDEVISAGLRAEDELKYLEEQEQERENPYAKQQLEEPEPAKPPSKSKRKKEEKVEEPVLPPMPTGRLPVKPGVDPIYGDSVFDRIRKRNEAKYEEEQKRKEDERKRKEEEEGVSGTLQTERAKPREMSPFVKKHYEAATSTLKEPPKMKAWERLLPLYTMAILVIGGCFALAGLYKPPARSQRLYPDIPPAATTVVGLIMINLSIYALWKVPPLWKFFNRYMMVVAATPRPLQLVGAIFSHQKSSHMIGNMIMLWFFGIRLHDEIGRGNFLALYLGSGVLGALLSSTVLILRKRFEMCFLGASGAIYGIMAAYFWHHKFDEFRILGYPPGDTMAPQGLAFLGLVIGIQIWGTFISKSAARASIDWGSHWGGLISGVASMELLQRHLNNKARIRAEKLKRISELDKVPVPAQQEKPSGEATVS